MPQPVGMGELVTAGAVKKYYRKSNLIIHPDKVVPLDVSTFL
jgi:hypothetical protein